MPLNRRDFLRRSGALAFGAALPLGGLRTAMAGDSLEVEGFGDLVKDAEGLLDLPGGFSYRVFSKNGETMDDGLFVPCAHDGMAAFPGPKGTILLVRNHELKYEDESGPFGKDAVLKGQIPASKLYDSGAGKHFPQGGTTTLTYDIKNRELLHHHLSLAGTGRNCGGGATPWGSWITCEEWTARADDDDEAKGLQKDHGYAFEVPSRGAGLADPIPLRAMGRFNREAVAVDPGTGIVYQTEDSGSGVFYRFIPAKKGRLAEGGRLEALAIADMPGVKTRNHVEQTIPVGEEMPVRWIRLDDPDSPDNDLRKRAADAGAAQFTRGEGIIAGSNEIYFLCTNGGKEKMGQVWRYRPSPREGRAGENTNPGTLELFAEPNDRSLMKMGDNLTLAPFGDLIICEDSPHRNRLVGVTPEGRFYRFGENHFKSEFAGSTFSPDGSTLFVNIQRLCGTLAITGPWGRRKA